LPKQWIAYNRVAGFVVTGNEDGAHQVQVRESLTYKLIIGMTGHKRQGKLLLQIFLRLPQL
jgi:hypothetical protein